MHLFERWGDMHLRVNGGSLDDPAHEALLPELISVTEQSNNLIYRGRETNNNTLVPNWAYRAAMSYVTGTACVQVRLQPHARVPRGIPVRDESRELSLQYAGRGDAGEPDHDDEPALHARSSNMDNDLGIFAQDRWTMDRITLILALRFDAFATSFPEQTVGPAPLVPTRNITFPAQPTISIGRTSAIAPASSMTSSATARPPSSSRSTSTCSDRR